MSSNKYIQYQILDKIISFIEEGLLDNKSRRPGYNKMNKFYSQFLDDNRKQLAYKVFNNLLELIKIRKNLNQTLLSLKIKLKNNLIVNVNRYTSVINIYIKFFMQRRKSSLGAI